MVYRLNDVSKTRSCLMCNKKFKSKGVGNRRCPKCERLLDARVDGTFDSFRYKISSASLG